MQTSKYKKSSILKGTLATVLVAGLFGARTTPAVAEDAGPAVSNVPPADELPRPGPISQVDPETQALWPFGASQAGRSVRICWEKVGNHDEKERAWAEDQVRKTWQAHSGIAFEGWKVCEPGAPGAGASGVRILLDERLYLFSSALGRNLDRVQNGVILGFGLSNTWIAACMDHDRSARAYERCFRWQVTHAFGHVLGLADRGLPRALHSAALCKLRKDTPTNLIDDLGAQIGVPKEGEASSGSRDDSSTSETAMTLCPSARLMTADAVSLSESDIVSVRKAYR